MRPVMETSSPTVCAHCGLPVPAATTTADLPRYCCTACRVVALMVGQGQGVRGSSLLRLGLGTLLAMNVMMVSLLLYSGSAEPETVPVFRAVLLCLAAPALVVLLPRFWPEPGASVPEVPRVWTPSSPAVPSRPSF